MYTVVFAFSPALFSPKLEQIARFLEEFLQPPIQWNQRVLVRISSPYSREVSPFSSHLIGADFHHEDVLHAGSNRQLQI